MWPGETPVMCLYFIIIYLNMYVYYVIEGGIDMFFNNIINEICDISLHYYSLRRQCITNDTVRSFLNYHVHNLINKYHYKDDEVESIVVSFNTVAIPDLVVNNLDNTRICCIKQYITTNIFDTSKRGYNNDFHISLNVCPFEGLTIDSDFIISVCDCMMY